MARKTKEIDRFNEEDLDAIFIALAKPAPVPEVYYLTSAEADEHERFNEELLERRAAKAEAGRPKSTR